MGEKIYVTIPIDEDIFFQFLKSRQEQGQIKVRHNRIPYATLHQYN